MKALFLAVSPLGFGETLIGLSLADQIAPLGVTSRFVVEDISRTLLAGRGYEFDVIEPSMGKLARLIIDDVIERFRPDVVVLADYFTYSTAMELRYHLDPWFVEAHGAPIVPIDIWEWASTDFTVDIAGDHVFQASDRFRAFPVHLQPVPLAHLDTIGGTAGRPFCVWHGEEPISAAARSRLRAAFGVGHRDRLVLLATARWQVASNAPYSEAASAVASCMPRIVTHYLERLPERTHFLLIGDPPASWPSLPACRTHVLPPRPPLEFGAVLQATDAVLSLNIAGTTVWRAVMSGIPAMVLGNSYLLHDAADVDRAAAAVGGFTEFVRAAIRECLPLHPFRMWPLGFHSFLTPLLTANPYTDAISRAEILDEPVVVESLTSLLFDSGFRSNRLRAQQGYADMVRGLPETREVFGAAAELLGITLG